jgi:uncharacterized protein DUF2842
MLPPRREGRYDPRMTARVRKLIGMVAILAFLAAYVAVVATLGDRLPRNWLVQVIYFGLAGVLWGVPLFPLISWMNRGR